MTDVFVSLVGKDVMYTAVSTVNFVLRNNGNAQGAN